jgi:hypothetical protein
LSIRLNKYKRKIVISKWTLGSLAAATFWYVSLFPGRIGSDPVQSVELMKEGKSTDWWTAIYFWFLKIATFNGNSIWLASLISLAVLFLAVYYFIYSLPGEKQDLQKALLITCATPIFGNFGVNINHDVFFTSGVLLLLGYSLRQLRNKQTPKNYIIPITAIILLLNAKTGYLLILAFLIFQLYSRVKKTTVLFLGSFAVVIFLISGLGISKSPVPKHFLPAIADLKCVTQHPDARISTQEWQYLASIADLAEWKLPKTCSSMDIAIGELRSKKLEVLNNREFFTNYLSIATKNPSIVIQAHLQRSSQALPPPFFQGPENQVDRNIQNPVGLNTNIALQLGPSVLHPSIDYPDFKIKNDLLKWFESLALFFSFLINQASWFWGWGGLWLWPVFIYFVFPMQVRTPRRLFALTYPLALNHFQLIMVGPIPAPRYVMSTILTGYILSILLILQLLKVTKKRGLG